MKKTWILTAAIAPHIFCCGLPAVLAILGLFGAVGADLLIPEWLEISVFVFSGLALVASFVIYRRSCRCGFFWILVAAAALYVFSLAMHFV